MSMIEIGIVIMIMLALVPLGILVFMIMMFVLTDLS